MAWLWWVGAVLLLAVVEVTTLDLMFLLLAAGSGVAAVSALLGAPVWAQFLVFAVASGLFVGGLRPWLLEHWRKRVDLTPTNAAALVGKKAIVVSDVVGTGGRVKLHGSVWSARADQLGVVLRPGTEVTVVRIEGATAIVRQDNLFNSTTAYGENA